MRRLRWFGSGWDHPDLLMGNHVRTPAGQACLECGRPIEADDQGLVVIPASDRDVQAHMTSHPVHRSCSERAMPDDRAGRMSCAECGCAPFPEVDAEDYWRAYSDGLGEPYIFCPECAERDFGEG
jgi:hypothetical protein